MNAQTRRIAAIVFAGAGTIGLVIAQGAPPPAPAQGGGGGRGRSGGFTQYTRPQAPPDVIARGKALYETNCASCHAVDLRGTMLASWRAGRSSLLEPLVAA